MPKTVLFDEQEVLTKAMMLFWKKGYHNTSIGDLVDHLGINRSSIYNSFGGKKQLYHKAFEFYQTSNSKGLKHFLSTQTDIKATIRMMFQKIISDDHNDIDCKGCFMVKTTVELLPHDKELQAALTAHKQKMEAVFLDLLQKGVERGQISAGKDLKTIAKVLYTFMNGIRVIGKTRPPQEELMAEVEMVLSLLN